MVAFSIILTALLISISVLARHKIEAAERVQDNWNMRCSYLDSVNISDAEQLPNGYYLHDQILYPPTFTQTFNYRFVNLTYKEQVAPHLRGCICQIKSCIQLCCPKNQIFDHESKLCVEDANRAFSKDVEVHLPNGNVVKVDIFNNKARFGATYGSPCSEGYFLVPQENNYDDWELFSNGSLHIIDHKYYTKDEFCFSPYKSNDSNTYINPFICYEEPRGHTLHFVYLIAMLFSVPFMVVTIFVYALIPELRNLHGKSLISYLLSLSIGYSIMCYIKYTKGMTVTFISCHILGFTAYYFLLASFFWLSVISFDLWWNFRGTRGISRLKEFRRFLIYSAYGWGLPFIMFVIAFLIQTSDDVNVKFKPGIDGISYCWLNTFLWIQFAYFFGPLIIIIIFNTSMFALTSFKIRRVQIEMSRIMAREDSRRNLECEKDQFGLFLRLFVIMGVAWSMETISWLVSDPMATHWIFYVPDLCNSMQGFLIFCLFVLKRKVKVLVVKRYHTIRGISSKSSQYSSKTNSSNITMMSTLAVVQPDKQETSLMEQN